MSGIDELVDLAAQLRGAVARGLNETKTFEFLQQLLAAYQPQVVAYHENCIWFRCVHCPTEEGFQNLRRCIYRPGGSPSFGRANLRDMSVLYAAWNQMTAFDETHAGIGDLVQIIGFNVQPSKVALCVNVGDIQRRHGSGRSLFDDPNGISERSTSIR